MFHQNKTQREVVLSPVSILSQAVSESMKEYVLRDHDIQNLRKYFAKQNTELVLTVILEPALYIYLQINKKLCECVHFQIISFSQTHLSLLY